MISRLKVERFKTLVNVDLELGWFNVFIGANGSGKSNLLEALGVLGAAASGRVDDETLLRRGVRPGVPRLYKASFPNLPKANRLFFRAESMENAAYEVALWNPIGDPSPAWRFMTEQLKRDGESVASRGTKTYGVRNQEQGVAALQAVSLEPNDPALLLMEELRSFSIYSPNTPSLRGLVQDLQSREPVGLAGGRLPEAVEELLALARNEDRVQMPLTQLKGLIEWATDFSAAPSLSVPLSPSAARSRMVVRFTDRYMSKKMDVLTGYDASEGALYLIYFAALALHPKAPRCIAIDNLDHALNPRLGKSLIDHLVNWVLNASKQQQWLITAHNPGILDGLPLDDDRVRLFAVDRDSNGHTNVKRISLQEAAAKRPDQSWTLSRMWIAGLLGAVPNV